MFVYSGNAILFSISIPFSGNQITELISEKLEISRIQAEKAKIICGLDESKAQGVVKKILDSQVRDLISKIKEVVTYFNDYYSERGPLDKIIITGGGSRIKNIDKLVSDEILIETIVGDPLINLSGGENIINSLSSCAKNGKKASPSKNSRIIQIDSPTIYSTAIGLALRNIIIDD
jgi:Tfp pilus assembly PilM family ATPase